MLQKLSRFVVIAFVLASAVSVLGSPNSAQAACTNPASTYGTDTVTYTIPTAGTYRVWSRIQAPDTTNNSFYLQVDGGCAITVGDSAITANTLTWVDYQDGASTSKIDMTLTAGSHTFVLTGREPNVIVDRVVFSTVASCIPTGTGDNCAIPPTPTATPSVSPTATPTATATPVHNAADLNNDSKVNVFDLSILLSHWGSTGTGDVDGNGTVNVFDLSRLLSAWTG
jgi:hypothetical protein